MRGHLLILIAAVVAVSDLPLHGQEAVIQYAPAQGAAAQPVIVGPDGRPRAVPGGVKLPPGATPGRPGGPMPPKAGPDAGKKDQPAEGKDAESEKKDGDAKVLKRPDQPPMPADPAELKAEPDADGLVQFSFRYQSWPDVLDWLAGISRMNLDWQELPKDYLNLTTQRPFTVVATRDLLNRHLLARGFTMLEVGEDLSVVAVAKLNPAMVPRVQANDLEALAAEQPYKFVKVSFSLDWLLAEQAAKELEPMLSSNGKLTPLSNTNRLEGMDAAINLREIHALLKQEQSETGESPLVQEFVLLNARAADVLAELETLLGLQSKKAPTTSMSSSQMRAMQQQQMQMMQQMAQQRGGKAPVAAAKKEAAVNLVVNKRKNSILAHAPPDKMAIIEQAIEALDVRPSHSDSLLARPNQMEIYRLNNLDPAALAKTLEDLGDLQPTTRLDIDEKNNALIVYGALVDQAMIRQLVQRLDGSSRHFEVIRLRRLAADYVAGTIEFMMVGDEEKEERPRYFDYFSSRYGGRNQDNKSNDAFRVDADVQNNMLLLWANEQEVEAVMQLLEKLGELPPQGGNPDKVRVLSGIPPEAAAEFLEKLRRAWPSLAPNELKLPQLESKPENDPDEAGTEPPVEARRPTPAKEARGKARQPQLPLLTVAMRGGDDLPAAEDGTAASEEAATGRQPAATSPRPPAAHSPQNEPPQQNRTGDEPSRKGAPPEARTMPPERSPQPAGELSNEELLRRLLARQQQEKAGSPASPVTLSFAPDGSLVITSDDTEALDVLEELISQTAPPTPDYKIYKLQYADAYWVMDNIEEFFKEDEEEENPFGRIFFGFPSQQNNEPRSRLSQRRKLKFIYDLDTNSILVQGANARQLKTIEDLIEVYDQPEPTSSQSARVSQSFALQYSKATIVANAIKDVYRDLLSSNDKALQTNNPESKNRESREATYIFGGAGGDEPERTQVKFKGKLSIGVDEISNTLLVSAEGENLMLNVAQMIETLDEAAKPLSSYSVVHLKGSTNAERVRQVLATLLSEGQSSSGTPSTSSPQGPPGGQPGARENRPGRGNGNRSGVVAAPAVAPN